MLHWWISLLGGVGEQGRVGGGGAKGVRAPHPRHTRTPPPPPPHTHLTPTPTQGQNALLESPTGTHPPTRKHPTRLTPTQGQHALLESPTGTGKTLCLLCAALAWRQSLLAQAQARVEDVKAAPHASGVVLGRWVRRGGGRPGSAWVWGEGGW